jgi:16S rRNA (guanine527-N7)-methyltransferase
VVQIRRHEIEFNPMRPTQAAMRSILEACGLRLPAEQLDRLWHYHNLLRAADAELNLTRIRNFENMVLKHYVDSLLPLKFETLPSPLVDMGSGPGLPGIPLKIARPDVAMILAEPRGARAEFLDRVVEALGLENVEVYAGKVGPRFPRTAKGVITRAVATIPETLDRVAAVIEPGGRMLFMKGPDCDAEIAAARGSHAEWFRLKADHRYAIPGTTHDRRLVVYERTPAPAPAVGEDADDAEPAPRHAAVREVTSAANPTFKHAKELLHGRGIRKHGQALIAGARIVAEVIERHPDRVLAWLTGPDGTPPPVESLTWYRLAEPLFRDLDVSGTHSPLLMVTVPELPAWTPATPLEPGCTLFVPFQDPENVGAVIRSAAAFGAARVVLLRESAHPFHPRAARAAGTALFSVPISQGPPLADLDPQSVPLVALDADGDDLDAAPWPEAFGLVVGLEGPGLTERLRHGPRRRIPIAPEVESLNAATAAAVALYAWRRGESAGNSGA